MTSLWHGPGDRQQRVNENQPIRGQLGWDMRVLNVMWLAEELLPPVMNTNIQTRSLSHSFYSGGPASCLHPLYFLFPDLSAQRNESWELQLTSTWKNRIFVIMWREKVRDTPVFLVLECILVWRLSAPSCMVHISWKFHIKSLVVLSLLWSAFIVKHLSTSIDFGGLTK